MATSTASLTGVERTFDPDDIIVSKTDLKGRILYGNKVFIDISGYAEKELMGAPHSILRHPHMPRAIFKLLWETIQDGREIFAYVVNRCKNGDYYWVFAHVTPSFTDQGEVIGYHSSRRVPEPAKLEKIKPLYRSMLDEEKRHANGKDGMAASYRLLTETLAAKGLTYDAFIFSL
ncbi:PAS domain-containing protein [Roseospirillum parvum]|uniref:PAS domain S-box-containing protein n=1 Tax=Roseospirillum parvum TaxID=83401 RepID=A0A1G8C2M7_9PROT|nr:PAS domain S-box protein [Roseospirillum parvum]SDH39613.1 PAS domain S-box-containing protein [Roseospirillum parvum]